MFKQSGNHHLGILTSGAQPRKERTMILCMGERILFPDDVFRTDEYGNRIHAHQVLVEHYARNGLPVKPYRHPVPETFAEVRRFPHSSFTSLRFDEE